MSKHGIETIRHSTAHLMAHAITRLWPNDHIEFGVGPVIEHGFYYDVDMERNLNDEDLRAIEKQMKMLIKEALPVEREVFSRKEAVNFFTKEKQKLKLELIEAIEENEEISCYRQKEFIDLCRGPHITNTKELPTHFKLLHIAGAYWRGDEKNKMLQRIYAVCFLSKEELKMHLQFLEEAKKRDHRKLGKELDLFYFNTLAAGSPFFLPKGTIVYNKLIAFIRSIYHHYNYKEVITPQLLDEELWHTSGHYQNYKDNMYFCPQEAHNLALKPMNCPSHMLLFKSKIHSYRELPIRYADFGRLHRCERAGAIGGLTRVRSFAQDDAHIFIQIEKIEPEILKLLEMFLLCYEHFKFKNPRIALSTRPDKRVGDDASWDQAENALESALKKSGLDYNIKEKDGAFYGPKIDIDLSDALGRYHQLGTIQLDFQLPERFNLTYTQEDGSAKRPVVIHRALLGSIERFFAIYLEHTGGVFPFWLAPCQAVIIPVKNEQHESYAKELGVLLKEHNFRIDIDTRNESLGYKTRQTQKQKIPFMLVVGDKEVQSQTVSLRKYGEKQSQTLEINELLDMFLKLEDEKNLRLGENDE